jgi:hypothetical protein
VHVNCAAQARAVKQLLAHRLPGSSSNEAKAEWYAIVEGRHALWNGVSEPYKHMIRAFLVHFQLQILSQVTHEFNFMNGSIGEGESGIGLTTTLKAPGRDCLKPIWPFKFRPACVVRH